MAIEDKRAARRQKHQAPVAHESARLVVQERRDQLGVDRNIERRRQRPQADRAGRSRRRRPIQLEQEAPRDVEDPPGRIESRAARSRPRPRAGSREGTKQSHRRLGPRAAAQPERDLDRHHDLPSRSAARASAAAIRSRHPGAGSPPINRRGPPHRPVRQPRGDFVPAHEEHAHELTTPAR